jgi:transposase
MEGKASTPCAECQRLRTQVGALQAQFDALQATVAQLQAQLAQARKDSSTSSKPPSSDLVKPPKPAPPDGTDKRQRGGQPGHPHHQRQVFPPELLNGGAHSYALELCPACGRGLQAADGPPRVVQQIEIEVVPLCITEPRALAAWCPHCQKIHYASWPPGIEQGGLVGPRLATLIAYLKGACHASYSTIRKFLRDVLQLTISRGQLAKVIGKVSQALDGPYQELLEKLPAQARLNVDETGHHDQGEQWWTWCFRASLYTLFKIDPTRSGDVLLDVLVLQRYGDRFRCL